MAWIGYAMVITFMYLIMSRRLSAVVALVLVPVAFAVASGFAPGLGKMIIQGIITITPTAMLLMFAILFFGVMYDAGLFEPAVRRIIKAVGNDPLKIAIGTSLLSTMLSLDGDGATTVLIVVTALLPIYLRTGMNPLIIPVLLLLANTPLNLSPWAGPSARAASVLGVDPTDIFIGLIPTVIVGVLLSFVAAYWLGRKERKRLGWTVEQAQSASLEHLENLKRDHHRPRLFWVNLLLTLSLIGGMATGLAPLPVLLMVGFALALLINYPNLKEQKQRVSAHADAVLSVVVLIVAAGAFTGIISGTGMVDAMSKSLLAVIPESAGPYLGVITAVASLPLSFFVSNDAFYFGILPVLSHTAAQYGIDPLHMARASMLGLPVHALSPLVASGYLMSGLLDRDFGELQRFCLKWALLSSLLLIVTSILTGAII